MALLILESITGCMTFSQGTGSWPTARYSIFHAVTYTSSGRKFKMLIRDARCLSFE
jgi:hypothetical protein